MMKILLPFIFAFAVVACLFLTNCSASAQEKSCSDIISDTGKFASPKNFYTQKPRESGISLTKQFQKKDKAEYIVTFLAYNPEFFPAAQQGLVVEFENGEKINHPELRAFGVKCTNKGGCVYEANLTLSPEEMKLLKLGSIVSYTIGSYKTKVTEGEKYRRQLSCLESMELK